jgi:hypothetical protein
MISTDSRRRREHNSWGSEHGPGGNLIELKAYVSRRPREPVRPIALLLQFAHFCFAGVIRVYPLQKLGQLRIVRQFLCCFPAPNGPLRDPWSALGDIAYFFLTKSAFLPEFAQEYPQLVAGMGSALRQQ